MAAIQQHLQLDLERSTRGTVLLECRYLIPNSVRELKVNFPAELKNTDLKGFTVSPKEGYKWDGTTNEPTLTFEMHANESTDEGYEFVDEGSWAIIQCPNFSVSWKFVGEDLDFKKSVSMGTEGAASSDGSIIYLGPYQEYNRSGSEQEFRLVVPDAANLTESPDRILSSLTKASGFLTVGSRNETVLAVAAPSEINWGWGGLKGGENGFWVQDNYTIGSAGNPWIHEYVHTRQSWKRGPETDWLVEGIPEYYAALCTYLQDEIPFEAFYKHVTTEKHSRADLTAPESWDVENVAYTKGRRVVAGLDSKIRMLTDNRASFIEVFNELNKVTEESLTHDRFCKIVHDIANSSIESWIEKHVRGESNPPIPEDSSLFTEDNGSQFRKPAEQARSSKSDQQPGVDQCPICGTDISSGDEFCGNCGTPIGVRCPACGRGAAGEDYCPECGTDIVQYCDICGTRRHGSEAFCSECGFEFGK